MSDLTIASKPTQETPVITDGSHCASSGWMMVAVRPAGRRVVIVGSGPVARRRAELFVSRGAMVEMFDPSLETDTPLPDGVAAQQRVLTRQDLKGAWLAIVATNDMATNRQVSQWCDEIGVACNRADNAEEGTLAVPAVVEGEPGWKVGILGGEAGPLFSVWLKGVLGEVADTAQVERVYAALADARQRLEDSALTQEERAVRLRQVLANALEEAQTTAEPQPEIKPFP